MMHMEGNRMNINQGVSTKIIKIGTIVALFLVAALVGRNLLFPNSAAAYTNSATGQNTASVAVIKGDVQEVSIKLVSSAYGPIVVQKGIPVRFTIEADARDINGCNGTVVVPAYNLQVALKPGDNVLEFTPGESGTIPYSCWMGMVSSSIQVVDDLSKVDPATVSVPVVNSGLKMPCCQR